MPTALSEILLHDLRVIDARSVVIEFGRGHAAVFPATRRVILHLVLAGAVDFVPPKSTAPISVGAGDCVLVFYGDEHCAQDAAPGPLVRSPLPIWSAPAEEPGAVSLGPGPACATLLTSALELAYLSPSAFVNRAGPDFFVLRRGADGGGCDGMNALKIDLDQVRMACKGPGATALAASLAGLLLIHHVRAMHDQIWSDRKVEILAPNTRRVAAALREIHAHLNRNWTVAMLAHEVGLSRSAFAEAFRAYADMPPLAYITELRMQRAKQLLEIDAITVREVAERVGYKLESSFARAFKKYTGASPHGFALQYRRLSETVTTNAAAQSAGQPPSLDN